MLLCFVCVGFGGQEPGKSEKVASARVWVTVSYWLWKCGWNCEEEKVREFAKVRHLFVRMCRQQALEVNGICWRRIRLKFSISENCSISPHFTLSHTLVSSYHVQMNFITIKVSCSWFAHTDRESRSFIILHPNYLHGHRPSLVLWLVDTPVQRKGGLSIIALSPSLAHLVMQVSSLRITGTLSFSGVVHIQVTHR